MHTSITGDKSCAASSASSTSRCSSACSPVSPSASSIPASASDVKPLGDIFIKLIKMVFAPIIFAMVVLGIARMENMKELGRVGARALIYFEVLSTFALGLGLLVVNLVGPGSRHERRPAARSTPRPSRPTRQPSAKPAGFVDFLLQHGADQHRRRAGQERHPADPGLRDPVRRRAVAHRPARQAGGRRPRLLHRRHLRRRRDDHAARTPRRLRRDVVHGRQVRTGLDRLARQADGHDVPHLRPVRGGGARLHLVALGLQPVEVPEVHQGRDLHGAGHELVRVGGAAADAQARVRRRLQAGRRPGRAVGRDLQSRTASASTTRWRRSSSPRPPTRR